MKGQKIQVSKMEDISGLLQEAKPLYFKRKRRRNQLKVLAAAFVCVWGVSRFAAEPSPYMYNLDNLDSQISQVADGSIIEDMGLPTDEFGLLMVV